MPKRIFKLPHFNRGVISNSSPRDIPEDALAYSDSVDSTSEGIIRGIKLNESVNQNYNPRIMTSIKGDENSIIGQSADKRVKKYDIKQDSFFNIGVPEDHYCYSMTPFNHDVYCGMSKDFRFGGARTSRWIGRISHAQFFNSQSSGPTLAENLTSGETGVNLSSTSGLSVGDHFMTGPPNKEIFRVNSISGNTVTVTRGIGFTDAIPHDSGEKISKVEATGNQYIINDAEAKADPNHIDIHTFRFAYVEDGLGSFRDNYTFFYGVSFIYDGFQESPLMTNETPSSTFAADAWKVTGTSDAESITMTLYVGWDSFDDGFSRRITGMNIYRADSLNRLKPTAPYRLVRTLDLTSNGNPKTAWTEASRGDFAREYQVRFTDYGDSLGATYEDNSGLPDSLESAHVNYKIAAELGGYMFIGDCNSDKMVNPERYIFRSIVGSPSIYNWTRDFLILPERPTAMIGYGGRLFAFSETNMYRINPASMVIEDIFEGVGCLNSTTLVATNYGMFHADNTHVYINDGRTSVPISQNISTDRWSLRSLGWKELKKTDEGRNYYASLEFDRNNNRLLCFANWSGYTSVCWAYDVIRKVWHLYDDFIMPSTTTIGIDGTLYYTQDGRGSTDWRLNSMFTNSIRKSWSIITKDFDFGSDSGEFWLYDVEGFGKGNFDIKYFKNGSNSPEAPSTSTEDGLRKLGADGDKMHSVAIKVTGEGTEELDNLTVQYRLPVMHE